MWIGKGRLNSELGVTGLTLTWRYTTGCLLGTVICSVLGLCRASPLSYGLVKIRGWHCVSSMDKEAEQTKIEKVLWLRRNRRSTTRWRYVTEIYLSHVSQILRDLQVLWLVCLKTVAVQIYQKSRNYRTGRNIELVYQIRNQNRHNPADSRYGAIRPP